MSGAYFSRIFEMPKVPVSLSYGSVEDPIRKSGAGTATEWCWRLPAPGLFKLDQEQFVDNVSLRGGCAGCEYLWFADNHISPLVHQRSRLLPCADLSVDLLTRCTDQGAEILL